MKDCEVRICLKGLEPFNLMCTYEEALDFFSNIEKERFVYLNFVMINTSELLAVAIVKIDGVENPQGNFDKQIAARIKDKTGTDK